MESMNGNASGDLDIAAARVGIPRTSLSDFLPTPPSSQRNTFIRFASACANDGPA